MELNIQRLIFPAAFSLNMFSMTVLLIILGFVNKLEMAADVGIVQSATMMIFMAFASNARNIILSGHSNITVYQLFRFRIILLIPLAIVAYYFSSSVISLSEQLVIFLIIRRGLEWVSELQISKSEMEGNSTYALRFSAIQIIALLLLVISIILNEEQLFFYALVFWSISPGLFIMPFITEMISVKGAGKINWRTFLPHIGSSWIISISTYVFRVFIILLAGKSLGGMLFSAFALGGMINSIYTYALGPTLSAKNTKIAHEKEIIYTLVIVSFLLFLGIMLAYIGWDGLERYDYSFYIMAVGFSLIGGAVMLLAQRKRIQILQKENESVFIQDVLSNILIMASVPFAFYIFGERILAGLFLWNSIIAFAFYMWPSFLEKHSIKDAQFHDNKKRKNFRVLFQSVIIFFIFFPIFFMFNESILFVEKDMNYQSQGVLLNLPLPFSSIACFIGIAFLVRFNTPKIPSAVLFWFFIMMLFSIFINASVYQSNELSKLILAIQYILPVFALVLGQGYVKPDNKYLNYQAIILYVLFIIVPTEVIATIIQSPYSDGFGFLTPYLYLFSIYQHLQYLPAILLVLFFLCVVSIRDLKVLRYLLLVLTPFMGAYTIMSFSNIALFVLVLGIFGLIIMSIKYRNGFKFNGMVCMFLIVSVSMAVKLSSSEHLELKYMPLLKIINILDKSNEHMTIQAEKKNIENIEKHDGSVDNQEEGINDSNIPINLSDRIDCWKIYWVGATENIFTVFFGNLKTIDRDLAPSAHNYYLGLFYHFGLIGIMPILFLLAFTIYSLYKNRNSVFLNIDTIVLACVVLFFLLVDNMLKVGLRQPYPGIIMFFLWGVLLNNLLKKKIDYQ